MNLTFLDERIKKLAEKNKKIKSILAEMGMDIEDNEHSKETVLGFKTEASCLKELKVACVMDRFTFESYKYECNLLELTPQNWKSEIDGFEPDLIFIESAWEGKDKLWYRKIANGSKEFFEMASYCQEKNMPIVFWNKEDPVYTDTFMPAASMADIVFTTDIDCVKKYKETLRHDNVFHLHFAAQPALHNPVEKYERKEKFCFAGAYYHKYKHRSEIFDKFSEIFVETKGFDIYDRNYKSALPEHAFPERYDKYILGKLDPTEIDVAYKGYLYGVNMNSESQSQTMFARRVFEMMASNTVTVGNYSRGVKNLFGDLTICTDDSAEMKRQLELFCNDETSSKKYRLVGLRSVLSQHLYEDRLDFVVSKVFKKSLKRELPKAVLFACGKNGIESFKKQTYANKKLYVVGDEEKENENIAYIKKENAEKILMSSFENSYVGVLNENDYYGANYVTDIMLALRYGNYDGIGKGAYYSNSNENIVLNDNEKSYKPMNSVNINRGLVNSEVICANAGNIFEAENVECENSFSVDEFNYCESFAGETCREVDDMFIADKGISMNKIEKAAEKIKVNRMMTKGQRISGAELAKFVKEGTLKKVKIKKSSKTFDLTSALDENENEYVMFEKLYNVRDSPSLTG